MKKIPNNGIWEQKNIGDIFGSILSSFNLDLSGKQGVVKVSPRMMINSTTSGVPFGFAHNDTSASGAGIWYAGVSPQIYVGGANTASTFSLDTATPALNISADRPDINTFNIAGTTYTFVMGNELYKLAADGSTYTQIGTLNGATNGGPLINFKGRLYFKFAESKMYSSDGSSISTTSYTIDLSGFKRQFINCGTRDEKKIYLGTWTTSKEKKALVYEWDGVSSTPDNVYEINAQAVLAIVSRFGVPWIIDSNGVLSALNGATFKEQARLPFDRNKRLPIVDGFSVDKMLVHYNGMIVDGDRILINVNGKYADGTQEEKVPSGVWEYNEINGLFHHESPSAWLNGTTETAADYGAPRIYAAGAIKKAPHADTSSNGNILAGYTYYTDSSTTASGIFINDFDDTKQKVGNFTTIKLFADNITDTWQKMFLRFRKLLTATDRIVVKYTTEDEASSEVTVTWAGTKAFTTATDLTGKVGYEVEILQGKGAGQCAHIAGAILQDGLYHIELDENLLTDSGTGVVRVQNWKKLGTVSSQTEDFKVFTPNKTATWIRFKVYMLSTGKNEVNDITIINNGHQLAQ